MVSNINELDENVILDSTALERVSHTKFLGVLIDDCLTWKNHIDCVSKTISCNIGVMNKLKHFVPTRVLHTLYCTLVLPYLNYGILIMGDFNAKIGQREEGEENIMGKFGYGERNRRGVRMVEFSMEHNLIVANTYFKKHKTRYWTWESPNGLYKNQIDYILCNQRGTVKNCEVITSVDIASDHRMVRATLKINKRLARLKFIHNKRKRRINILKLKEKREEFQLKIKNRFAGLELEEFDIDEQCNMVTTKC